MVDRNERRKGMGIRESREWSVSHNENLEEVMINSRNTVEANRNGGT